MATGLLHVRPCWELPTMYTSAALRNLHLPADCTQAQVRQAFLRETAHIAPGVHAGRATATQRMRKLIRWYRQALRYCEHRRSAPYFVAAHGALHCWDWRKGLADALRS